MNSNKSLQKDKKKKRPNNFPYDFVKVTGAIPALIWQRPRVIYTSKGIKKKIKKGVLISSNHISLTDPILLLCAFWYRRLFFLATSDLYRIGSMRTLLNGVRCIEVNKENFSLQSMHAVCDRLEAGEAILIFPEGQINQSESAMLSLKSGAILMAHRGHAPILPVYIIKAKKWYQRNVVLVGEPIDVRELCGPIPTMEGMERAGEQLRQAELALLEHYHQKVKKQKEITP